MMKEMEEPFETDQIGSYFSSPLYLFIPLFKPIESPETLSWDSLESIVLTWRNTTGSSAMAYKRNPMRSERGCALGRKLQNLPVDAAATYAQ